MKPFMISYAQNFEDVMLMRALGHIENGRYVDIGANDPIKDSVSFAFYQRGWRGVHVEPVATFADRLAEARPDESVIRAIIAADAEPMLFYNVVETGMSTGDPAIAAQHLKAGFKIDTQLTECLRLSTLLDDLSDREIHWLKIDVEGMERAVLESWSGSDVRPWIVVIESTKPNSSETTHEEWEHILVQFGYIFVYFDGLNRFYISKHHSYLEQNFNVPPNYFDNFTVTEFSIFARAAHDQLSQVRAALKAAEEARQSTESARQSAESAYGAELARAREIEALLSAAHLDTQSTRAECEHLKRHIAALTHENSVASHQLRVEIDGLHQELTALRKSASWRMTGPIRWSTRRIAKFARLAWAWLCFRPGTRPYRLSRGIRNHVRAAIRDPQTARRKLLGWIRPLPRAVARSPELTPVAGDMGPITYVFVGHTITCSTNTGVQRVVRGLSNALLQAGRTVRFIKWTGERDQPKLITLEERKYLSQWNGPALVPNEAGLYLSNTPSPLPPDELATSGGRFICPEVTSLISSSASITARLIAWAKTSGLRSHFLYYDGIPLRRPEFQSFVEVHAQYMRDLRLADEIWPISRWSGDELAAFWGGQLGLDNTHLPIIHPIHLPAEFDRERQTSFRAADKLILSVGTVEARKNQLSLVVAFSEILEDDPNCGWRLCLVGNLHPDISNEFNSVVDRHPQIEFKGHVPDAELSGLYERCAFTAFPSLAEGFGLPILESLWHGKPCLTANFGAMGEVAAGGGCISVDVRDTKCLKETLLRLMNRPALVEELARQAIARPMSTWSDYLATIDTGIGAQNRLIYYWVNSTATYPKNTGIQRVTRQLSRELISAGYRLVPVKWGGTDHPLIPATAENLEFFAQWNGPDAAAWHPWVEPDNEKPRSLFFMTELPLDLSPAEQALVRDHCKSRNIETVNVFHDVIPWKLKDIYDPNFTSAHRSYMIELLDYDKIMPVSHYSKNELLRFYHSEGVDLPRFPCRIEAHPLPAEFPERQNRDFNRRTNPTAIDDGRISILCVGTVEPRKNHVKMVRAFLQAAESADRPLALTIVGHDPYPELADELAALCATSPSITWDRNADDAMLRMYYESCDFTIFPSIEEGFGLPILESLWYGKPTICANFGAMQEVAAEGGGCLTVDVNSETELTAAILDLATNPNKREKLSEAARLRTFKSWKEYAREIAGSLGLWNFPDSETAAFHRKELGVDRRPRLSVCISTYNRANWLEVSLKNFVRLYPQPIDGVEFVICDNASADTTPDVVKPYLTRPDFVFRRNPANVGMLGNLRETTKAANGDYVWILGDDDLVMPGAIETVLSAIETHPNIALVYLNYAYTRLEDARAIVDFDKFFAESTPIVPAEPDLTGPIREICARNENFFTAIYTLVFRRDHALGAYSQDTSGRPFSTMLTCIPTTYYVLNNLMEEQGVWIGSPQLVVNLNVSWLRYAALWILERIPEVYQSALERGVPLADINRWRKHTMPGIVHYLEEIYRDDPLGNAAFFSIERLIARVGDLPEFAEFEPKMIEIYSAAHKSGNRAAQLPAEKVFPSLKNERVESSDETC